MLRMNTPHAAPTAPSADSKKDKDRPLIEDIRLLGRILGDVIREQEGAGVYDMVEKVRRPRAI
jgi:phosphoenolpyruvate carboxylase